MASLNDGEIRVMELELKLVLADLQTAQWKTKCETYESVLTQLPTLLTIFGMSEASAQERAMRLLSTLVNALEQFWHNIGEEHT